MFTINKWPSDSDISHYATTWILAEKISKDSNKNLLIDNNIVTITDDDKLKVGSDIIEEGDTGKMNKYGIKAFAVKSTKFVNAWEVGFDIPVSTIWFVSALRHLKDQDDNDISNDKWVGPTPSISDKSFKNEFFATKLYMQEPYISKFNYTPGDKIEIDLPKPKSNVFYLGTVLEILDENKDIILTKIYNIEKSEYKITITNDDIDLDKYNLLTFKLMHIGNHSTLSSAYKESFLLKEVFFNIVGRKKDLEPIDTNELVVKKTTTTAVEVNSAVLLSGDKKETLGTCEVIDKEIIRIPKNILNFKSHYVVKLELKIIYDNGETKTLEYFVPITTRDYKKEKISIIDDYYYENKFEEIKEYNYEEAPYRLSVDHLFNTEEFFTYLIPLPNKKEEDTSLFIFGREEQSLTAFKSGFLDMYQDTTLRLLTRDIGYIQTINENKLVLKSYDYDSYTDKATIKNTINTNLVNKFNYLRKVIEINGGYYVAGVNADNNKVIDVYKYSPVTNDFAQVASRTFDFEIEDISFVEQGYLQGLIYCKGKDVVRFYAFTATTNDIIDSIVLPTAFRNTELYLEQLLNGNIIGFKYNTSNKPLDYFVIDIKSNELTSYENSSYKGNGKLVNFTKLKNGNIITTLVETDDDKKIIKNYIYS